MNTPTYKEQFDKITEAYIKGDIKPMNSQFCFCGTLENNEETWCTSSIPNFQLFTHNYKMKEYARMEFALLDKLKYYGAEYCGYETGCYPDSPGAWGGGLATLANGYEDALFAGMCAAIEVLKQIHIERGEIIDEAPVFVKRKLV